MKKSLAGLTLVGALLTFGCGNDGDGLNDVVLLPTATATTTTSTTNSNSSTSTTTSTSTSSTSTTATTKVTFVQLGNGVNGTGTEASPFNTVAAAVNAAGENETIFVKAATDGTTVASGNVFLKPGQKLIGQGSGLSFRTIEAGAFPKINGTFTMADNTQVSGFEFVGASGTASSVIASGDNVTVSNNKFTNVPSTAIDASNATGAVNITSNTVTRNVAPTGGAQVANAIVVGNTVFGAKSQEGGKTLSPVTQYTVANNTVDAGGFINTAISAFGVEITTGTDLTSINVTGNTINQVSSAVTAAAYYSNADINITGNHLHNVANGLGAASIPFTGSGGNINVSTNDITLSPNSTTDTLGAGVVATAAGSNSLVTANSNSVGAINLDGTASTLSSLGVAFGGGNSIFGNTPAGLGNRYTANNNTFTYVANPLIFVGDSFSNGPFGTSGSGGSLLAQGNTFATTAATIHPTVSVNVGTNNSGSTGSFTVGLRNNTGASTDTQVTLGNGLSLTSLFTGNNFNSLNLTSNGAFSVEQLGVATPGATFGTPVSAGQPALSTLNTFPANTTPSGTVNGNGTFTSIAAGSSGL